MSVIHVSPNGKDDQKGTARFPLQTITAALQKASTGGIVQLAPGTYQNERFPLILANGITLAGESPQTVTIRGGGSYQPRTNAPPRNVSIVLQGQVQLRSLTLSNPQGTGLVIDEGAPLVIKNRIVDCQQHGALVSDTARPFFSENEFDQNGATGIALVDRARAEIRQNRFSASGEAITIRAQSAPLIINNQFINNRTALLAVDFARPVLRQNQTSGNQQAGLWTQDRAEPDIGHPQDPGDNRFEGKRYDIRNDAIAPIATTGNQLNPTKTKGRIAYLSSQIPDPVAVPDVLLGTPLPPPGLSEAKASPPPSTSLPGPSEAEINLDSRFNDLIGHWSAPFVEALADRDLIKGFIDGTFRPDNQVTRAQFAALVAATFPNVETTRPGQRFPDVPGNFWAAAAIRQVQSQGFISGFPDGSFRPNAPMTRVQAVVALVNGLMLGTGRSEALLIYSDRAQVPSYAIEAVAAATDRQIIVNYPDTYSLRPLVPITRAETAALVYQTLVALGEAPAIASPFIPEVAIAKPSFADLSERHWAAGYINALVQKGWLSGFRDGTFGPDEPMTRAQFAVLLVGAFDSPPKRPAISFRDVPSSFWGADVIQQAYRAEFISGFPDLTFDPNFPLTKLQALLALVSGLDLQRVSPPELASLKTYDDQNDIPRYAKEAIASATQLALVFNHPIVTELRPNRTATRAEASAMVYQALVIQDRMPALSSRYQVDS
ncbi:MAG: S-layer homology domain-containing protein [Cyanobacteria bacterium P01_D01_bin.1]